MHAKRGVARAQSAMEYLTTYSWAILIIAVVIVTLFSLGVFSSNTFAPRASPGSCQVYRPGGPGSIAGIALSGACGNALPQFVATFDGQTSYVTIPFASLLNPQSNQVSVTAWVKSSSSSYYPGVWQAVSRYNDYILGTSSTNAENMQFIVWTTSGWQYQASVNINTPSTWHFFAGVFNGASNTEYLYVDGNAEITTTTAGTLSSDSNPLYIGKRGCCSDLFGGEIADVQVYNTSLSANEVQSIYLEGVGGAPLVLQNLVGWWPLNENVYDYSGNNYNGTPSGITYSSTWTNGYTAP